MVPAKCARITRADVQATTRAVPTQGKEPTQPDSVLSVCMPYHRFQLLCHRFVVNHHLVHLRNELIKLGRVALANCPWMPQQVYTAVNTPRRRNNQQSLTVPRSVLPRCEAYCNAARHEGQAAHQQQMRARLGSD